MTDQEINNLIDQKIKDAAQAAQYGVTRVPVHTHNNIDSPNLLQHSVAGFASLPGTSTNTSNGMADPNFLDGESLSFGNVTISEDTIQYTNIYNYPIPVIYGFGIPDTATLFDASVTMTGGPIIGATTATLTGNWADPTGNYWVKFSTSETRFAHLINGSTAVTWTGALTVGGATTALVVGGALYNATSAFLTGAWGGVTGPVTVQFSTNEVRTVNFTNSSTAISWSIPLTLFGTTAIDIIGNTSFKGGDAPYGTLVAFRNATLGTYQLWMKTQPGAAVYTWSGVDMGGTGLFIV